MSDDLKVDWEEPIEAVTHHGLVAEVIPHAMPSAPRMRFAGAINGRSWGFEDNGLPLSANCPWRIRNVAATQQDAINGEVAYPTCAENARVEPWQFAESAKIICAAVDAVFVENINDQASRLGVRPVETESPGWWQQRVRKAAVLAALLPEPVDADREEAKRIAAEWYSEEAPHIAPLTEAIRRGRVLERDSREG